jgi:hypothetical protein
MMKGKGISKLVSRLSELGHARRKLSEGVSESEDQFVDEYVRDLEHVDHMRNMRRRGVFEDHPSGNWFVTHNGTRVSGPHPSEEQATIYRDNYVTTNPGTPLSEMNLERTDVVNEETVRHPSKKKAYVTTLNGPNGLAYKSSDEHGHVKWWNEHGKNSAHKHAGLNEEVLTEEDTLNELSVEKLRHYETAAITQMRAEKGNKALKKKLAKRDKMVDMAARKVVGDDRVKVHASLDETNLLGNNSYAAYAKHNEEEEEKIEAELKADAEVGATDPQAEEENKHLKGSVSEDVEDLEEGRRGRPRKDAKPIEGDEQNVIMGLRKASYSTVGHKVQFKDGSEHVIHADHAAKVLNHYNGLKPHEKEQFQTHIHMSHSNLSSFHEFTPKPIVRSIPAERKLFGTDARTVKKANRVIDRRETIRRIAQKLKMTKEAK